MIFRQIHKSLFLISCIIAVIFLGGCYKAERYYPVRDYTPRASTLGFSITPPAGDHWYEKCIGDSLVYYKKTEPEKYSITTSAKEIRFQNPITEQKDLLNHVKRLKQFNGDPLRYKNYSSNFSQLDSKLRNCIEYHQSYEDHSYRNIASGEYIISKQKGLFCQHPKSPKIGIDISYKELSRSKTTSARYTTEGEGFLSNLTFY